MGVKIDPYDIVGNRYGMLTVYDYGGKRNKKHYYKCKCDCGNESIVSRNHLISGDTRSCGCMSASHADVNDLIGERVGSLEVMEYIGFLPPDSRGKRQSAYLCKCDCGNLTVASRNHLKAGFRRTCGNCNPTRIEKEDSHYRYYCGNGESWIFSPEDLELVKAHRWHISTGYAYTYVPDKPYQIAFHVLATQSGNDNFVDHIDGNTHNNMRENLRIATPSQNGYNRRMSSGNRAGFKGVTYIKETGRYRAAIDLPNGKRKRLGTFDTAIEAAQAYDNAARKYAGEFACLNFPRIGERSCIDGKIRVA